jgi:hypothetical protein
LFGRGGSAADRLAQSQSDRSILDVFRQQVSELQRTLGPHDRSTINDYLESVREIERRAQNATVEQPGAELALPQEPVGIPYSYEEHVKLMYDLMLLAYRANITRVATFMLAREESARTYPQVDVPDSHHAISHHANQAVKLEKNVRIQTYHVGLFAQFLEKMRSIPEGNSNMLENSVLLFGSNMSNSNAHNHFPLPNFVAGGGAGTMKGGRHLKYEDHTPMTNLVLTLLDKAGVRMDSLGDSTGKLENL